MSEQHYKSSRKQAITNTGNYCLIDWSVCLVINLVNNPIVPRAAENDES